MRLRLLLFTVGISLLVVAAGAQTAQAQSQGLAERNSSWETRTVIVLPVDDEGDDEGSDCLLYPAPVPATGHTGCWDEFGDPIDCAGTGQDGEHQAGVSVHPRFTDNGAGTVTDNLSGLVWLQDADCFGLRDWSGALSDANTLADGFCGLTDSSVAGDWRLPNLKEQYSLLDLGQVDPALPAGHPFFGTTFHWYWSSSAFAGHPSYPWMVLVSIGFTGLSTPNASHLVWPVRGPE